MNGGNQIQNPPKNGVYIGDLSSSKSRHLQRKPAKSPPFSGLIRSHQPKGKNDSFARVVYTKDQRSKQIKNCLLTTQKSYQNLNLQNQVPSGHTTQRNNVGSSLGNRDSSEYYKYWKNKAKQYQSENFKLERLNSTLQEENQILKHKYQKLEKKYEQAISSTSPTLQIVDYPPFEHLHSHQIQELKKNIEDKDLIIQRQQKKIKELSKHITQNAKLKVLLGNLQDRVKNIQQSSSRESSVNKQHLGSQKIYKKFSHAQSTSEQNSKSETQNASQLNWQSKITRY